MGYKTNCPHCGGNNFYVSEKLAYCFTPGCGYYERDGTQPIEQKTRSPYLDEIRAYYYKVAHYYHSALTGEPLAYLHRRGFTDATIEQMKIGYCPVGKSPLYHGQVPIEAGLATKTGEAFLGDRITFPYFYDSNTITEIRGRALNNDIKYKSPYNSTYYRGSDYPYNMHLHKADTLILTEGEIKADLAVQIGYPTLALPGMGVWKSGFKQRTNQRVIILFDSQRKNGRYVIHAINKAALQLDNPYVATLPLFDNEKMDIDQFILTYGASGFSTVVQGALPYMTWKRLQRF